MLTAAAATQDLVQGLSLGADDYLTKPFRFAELVARIRALARRSAPRNPPILRHNGLELDPGQRRVTRDGHPWSSPARSSPCSSALMAVPGNVVSAETLLQEVWDEQIDPFTNIVRMTIMTLRRKLGEPQPIETVIGVGYRMA